MPAGNAQPVKLLIMTDTAILGPGGSERFLRNLLAHLPMQHYAIDVLQLSAAPAPQDRVGEIDVPGVRLLHQPVAAVYGLRGLATLAMVRRRVRRGEYDIVQSQHEKSDLINALLPRSGGLAKISNRRDMGFQKSARVRSVFRRINGRFDRLVAPTASILKALVAEENADPARCRTIANGVDTGRFRPADTAQKIQLRAQLGMPADAALIGCVASFSPVKRHVDLIEAFAKVARRHGNAQLLLVGEGPLRGDIQAQIQALHLASRVHLLGARGDVENILPALDIFALTSSTEGMSNAILEAQACGIAVVATAVGGTPDLVQPGRDGLLVPGCSPDQLATALHELLSDPRRIAALGHGARDRVEREHSLDVMAGAYDALYRELAPMR